MDGAQLARANIAQRKPALTPQAWRRNQLQTVAGDLVTSGYLNNVGPSTQVFYAKKIPCQFLTKFRLAPVEYNMTRQKRRIPPVSSKDSKLSQVGQVGIIFLLSPDRLLIESSHLSDAELCAGFVNHRRGHADYWQKLQAEGLAPTDEDYIFTPRGRVTFSVKTGRYSLLLDRCILRHPKLVREIRRRLNLPIRSVQISTDDHYRCGGCLGERQNEG